MSDKFTIEIITPDKTILKSEATEVTIPSFEGQMGILKGPYSLNYFFKTRVNIGSKSRRKKIFCRRRYS